MKKMKKLMLPLFTALALIATTVGLATAGTNHLTLRDAAGKVISSVDFNQGAMSYDDDCLQLRTFGGKTDVAIAMPSSFHLAGHKDSEGRPNSIDRPDWSDIEMGLGVNFLEGNKPAMKSHKSVPVFGKVSGDNPDVIVWSGLDLPMDGSVIVLTLPARFKEAGQAVGSWSRPNSHPWGWISWYNSACLRFGDGQIGYGIRYVNGRWEPVGIANAPGATDARQMSMRNN